MADKINYKKLWYELCEEKKKLQIENINLKDDSTYWRNEFEKLEKLHSKLINDNWQKDEFRCDCPSFGFDDKNCCINCGRFAECEDEDGK